jgi:hypothetical protein
MSIELAKSVLTENSQVLFGIFGTIKVSGYFPPRKFLNQFFSQGSDPCDQDGRMDNWKPFSINDNEYEAILNWWVSIYPNTVVDDLGQESWGSWSLEIVEME